MAAIWTRETILQAREAQAEFLHKSFVIGLVLAIASIAIFILMCVFIDEPNDYLVAAWLVIFLLSLTANGPVGLLLTYFSPPDWPTFGYKIGGFAPTSCEVSGLIDGDDAWPCQALRFKAWFLCLGEQQCRYLPESRWLGCFYIASVVLYTVMLIAYLPRHIALQGDPEEQARRRRYRLHGTGWNIERDVTRGISRSIARGNKEWGAGAKTMNVKTRSN